MSLFISQSKRVFFRPVFSHTHTHILCIYTGRAGCPSGERRIVCVYEKLVVRQIHLPWGLKTRAFISQGKRIFPLLAFHTHTHTHCYIHVTEKGGEDVYVCQDSTDAHKLAKCHESPEIRSHEASVCLSLSFVFSHTHTHTFLRGHIQIELDAPQPGEDCVYV